MKSGSTEREKRLAAALRENLKRRKSGRSPEKAPDAPASPANATSQANRRPNGAQKHS